MGTIIGIGGVSRAGKTSLAQSIKKSIQTGTIKILHQDEFIVPLKEIPLINGKTDWERPESLDFTTFRNEIITAAKNFDYVVAEGLMVYWKPEIYSLFDKKVFLHIEKDIFLNRKTIDFRWENEPDWYIEHIWENHFIYGQIPDDLKNVLCLSGQDELLTDIVLSYILE